MFANICRESVAKETLHCIPIRGWLLPIDTMIRTTFELTRARTDMYRTAMNSMHARLLQNEYESTEQKQEQQRNGHEKSQDIPHLSYTRL